MTDARQPSQEPQAPQKSGSGKAFLSSDAEIKTWRDFFLVAAMQRDNITIPAKDALIINGVEKEPAKNTTLANANLYEIYNATLKAGDGDILLRLFENMLQRTDSKAKEKFLFPKTLDKFVNSYTTDMAKIFKELQPTDFQSDGVGDKIVVSMIDPKNPTPEQEKKEKELWEKVDTITKAFEEDLKKSGFFEQVPEASTDKTFMNFLTGAVIFKIISNTFENLTKSKKMDELNAEQKGVNFALKSKELKRELIKLTKQQDNLQKKIDNLNKKNPDPDEKTKEKISELTKERDQISINRNETLGNLKTAKAYLKDQKNGTADQRIKAEKLLATSEKQLTLEKDRLKKLIDDESDKNKASFQNLVAIFNPLKKFVVLQKYRRTAPVADAKLESVATNPTPPAESVTAKPVTAEAKPVTPEAKPVTPEAKPVTPEAKPVTDKPPTSPNLKARVKNLRDAALKIGDKRTVKTFTTEAKEKVGQLAQKFTEIAKRTSAEPKHGTADIMTTLNPQWKTNPDWVNLNDETKKSTPTTPGNSETKKQITPPLISAQRSKTPPVPPSTSLPPKQESEKAIEKTETIEKQGTWKSTTPGGRRS